MHAVNRHFVSWFLVANILIFGNLHSVHSQQITRIAPSNITLRGISIADYDHTMVVGDSATVLINSDYLHDTTANGLKYVVPISHFKFLSVKNNISTSTTFYGVCYYDSTHAIIVGDAGIILTTTDEGQTWVVRASGTNRTLRAVTHITDNIFQIVGDGGLILRSEDRGSTWKSVLATTTNILYAEAFGSAKVGYVVGEHATILKTTDGGLTWDQQLQTGITHLNFYGVAMLDEHTATAVGDSALFRYTTDGNIWQTRKDSNIYVIAGIDSTPVRNAPILGVAYTGYPGIGSHYTVNPAAIAVGNSDLLYVYFTHFFTTNVKPHNDTTWIPHDSIWHPVTAFRVGDADGSIDAAQSKYNCIAVFHSGTRYLTEWAGPEGAIAICADSTTHGFGYGLNPAKPSFDNFLFASFDSNGYGYCTVTGAIVRKTSDNGVTWKDVLLGHDVSGVYCKDSNTAYVAGWGGALFRTTNGGIKWDSIPPTISKFNSLHGFAFTSPTTGLCVGDGGTVLRTFDGGNTWQNNTPPIPSFFKAIAFSNADTGVAVGDNGSMMNTSDGGASWVYNGNQPLSYPNSANLRYIQAFPNGLYYVCADSGIMKSSDYGQNWQLINGFPPDSVGMSFYNSQIGIVGLYSTSSKLVLDSMTLVYTTDGLKTTYQITVPFDNVHRLIAHWLNDCSFLLYGIDGYIMKVNFCGVNAVAKTLSPVSAPIRVYPNPSLQKVTLDYKTEQDGPVTIELSDELGKEVATLYIGTETQGNHTRVFTLNSNLHGTFFIRVTGSGKVKILRMIKL